MAKPFTQVATNMSMTECVELVDDMLKHAYAKGAFNDLEPNAIVEMAGAMSNMATMSRAVDQQRQAQQQVEQNTDAPTKKPCEGCGDEKEN